MTLKRLTSIAALALAAGCSTPPDHYYTLRPALAPAPATAREAPRVLADRAGDRARRGRPRRVGDPHRRHRRDGLRPPAVDAGAWAPTSRSRWSTTSTAARCPTACGPTPAPPARAAAPTSSAPRRCACACRCCAWTRSSRRRRPSATRCAGRSSACRRTPRWARWTPAATASCAPPCATPPAGAGRQRGRGRVAAALRPRRPRPFRHGAAGRRGRRRTRCAPAPRNAPRAASPVADMFERFRRARAANGTPRHLAETALDDSVDVLAPRIPMATLRDDLIACEECDALHRRSSVDGVGDEVRRHRAVRPPLRMPALRRHAGPGAPRHVRPAAVHGDGRPRDAGDRAHEQHPGHRHPGPAAQRPRCGRPRGRCTTRAPGS